MDRALRSLFALCLALPFVPHAATAGDQAPEPKRLGQVRKQYPHNAQHRTSIAFSPDGKKLAWVHHQFEGSSHTDGGMAIIGLVGGAFTAYGVDGEDLGWVAGTFTPTDVACNPHGITQAGVHSWCWMPA